MLGSVIKLKWMLGLVSNLAWFKLSVVHIFPVAVEFVGVHTNTSTSTLLDESGVLEFWLFAIFVLAVALGQEGILVGLCDLADIYSACVPS